MIFIRYMQTLQDDKIPEPPASGVPQGVLPRLIATLVNRRRQVKALMKDRSLSHAKWLQVALLAVFFYGRRH